jgi:hypothetical protein
MDLFSKILVSAIKALINKDLQIPAEELVHFCVDVYNNVEFITADGIEKNKIIDLSINSIIRGNKITLKKASTQRK